MEEIKTGDKRRLRSSGRTERRSSVLPAKQRSRFVVRNGSKSDGRMGGGGAPRLFSDM